MGGALARRSSPEDQSERAGTNTAKSDISILLNPSLNWSKTMVSFKACPRCLAGDVIRERDTFGWYDLCLQCGFVKDLKGPRILVSC